MRPGRLARGGREPWGREVTEGRGNNSHVLQPRGQPGRSEHGSVAGWLVTCSQCWLSDVRGAEAADQSTCGAKGGEAAAVSTGCSGERPVAGRAGRRSGHSHRFRREGLYLQASGGGAAEDVKHER